LGKIGEEGPCRAQCHRFGLGGGDEVRSRVAVSEYKKVKSDTCKIRALRNVLQCVLQTLIVTFCVTMTRNPLSRYPEMSNPPPLRKGRAT